VAKFIGARSAILPHDKKVHAALLVATRDRVNPGAHAGGRAPIELAHALLAKPALPGDKTLILFHGFHDVCNKGDSLLNSTKT
jgi:hypothetical protein